MESYLRANGIYHATMQEEEKAGVTVTFGGTSLFVYPGGAEIGSISYTTNMNGQMRFYEKNGTLVMQPFARDTRYAILLNET